jgi:gamma-glutamylcyclotransferase (GGCT)/AIG2-like uncharacterized protein YtfP
MDHEHMARTAPRARLLGRARLDGHRIAIGRAGYGTVVPDPDGRVHGVLWELTAADGASLDRFEGVAQGWYRREIREIEGADGPTPAMLYLAADATPGQAHPDYLRQVLTAAADAGLPPEYLTELAALPAQPGVDTQPWTPPCDQPKYSPER